MESFIKTEKLVFGYPTENNLVVNVLNDISLNINRGEFVVILGHNGCGKSTISKTFNAMLFPTSGRVVVSGLDTSVEKNVYEIRKKVGLVLQNPENQIIAGIVEEDVAFGPENIGVAPEEIRKRVDDALKVVGMYKYRLSSPYKLSGGQKQRVSIAGTIAMCPECIVFDEPTSMLDPQGRDEVISTIKKLNKELGITIVLITHFMDEAIEADRVVIMSKGRILSQGTPRQIFSDVNMLKKNYLDVPQATELIEHLRASGVALPRTVLTVDECVAVLSERIKKTSTINKKKLSHEKSEIKKSKICFENVSFHYGKGTPFEKKALDNISVSIDDGDFVGIIGHTGSGKSTFVQHLNGLLKPSDGRVLLDGVDINESREIAREVRFKVGLVFQYPEHQLFEDTVYDDIAFGPKNMGLSKNEINSRVMTAIEFVGLDSQILTKSPFDISGGEKRRVAIAGVIAMDPEVLVFDEPTAGLDPYGKRSLLEKIKSYHKARKNTVIMVSHNMEDIAKTANKIIVMSDGKIKMFDHTKSVFSQVDFLENMGLRVPQITKITSALKNAGADLSDGIIDMDTAVYEIKRLIDIGRF